MAIVGYEFLRRSRALTGFALECPAEVRPVTRVMRTDGLLAVPAQVAPPDDDALNHLLFAP